MNRINTKSLYQYDWLDKIKAIALIWIFLNHVVENIFGYPYFANPTENWPNLADKFAQLSPLDGYGWLSIPVNLLRYVGWTGDQGVQLFLVVSGFGLTWGMLNKYKSSNFSLKDFYTRRIGRIFPLWWAAHLGLLFIVVFIGKSGLNISPFDPRFYLSLLGLRLSPEMLYYISPSWWYIGLLIQLYLVFPLLWRLIQKHGPLTFLLFSIGISIVVRAVGLYLLDGAYIDAWNRGMIFITRLPEFALGMALATWLSKSPEKTSQALKNWRLPITAFICWLTGNLLSLTLAGMSIAPFLQGAGVFFLLYYFLNSSKHKKKNRALSWLGRHSYSIYLIHHLAISSLLPVDAGKSSFYLMAAALVAFAVSIIGGAALEWINGFVQKTILKNYQQKQLLRLAIKLVTLGLVVILLLICGELIIKNKNPQEVLGWGERPALQPNPEFGWNLKPSQTTQLQWLSYNYSVTANSLGFPGPEFPIKKEPGTTRIMVAGDAFSSAEGVDTEKAWPRLLESTLNEKLSVGKVEVMNFAITGYGPNQYLAIVEKFAPIYKPDVILVELFVNDFEDVMISNKEFQNSIGFGQPTPEGWKYILRSLHLRRFFKLEIIEPLKETIKQKPKSHGYMLGNFASLEKTQPDEKKQIEQITFCLSRIKNVAININSQLYIFLVPGSAQVCKPKELAYYPKHVHLDDSEKYDIHRPQRLIRNIADSLQIEFRDLLPLFNSCEDGCYYQPHNMHWTERGHHIVANYLSEQLFKVELFRERNR